MRPFTFWLFAALVTVSFIAVEVSPTVCQHSNPSYLEDSSDDDYAHPCQRWGQFESGLVETALGDTLRQGVTFSQMFVKILTKLGDGDLDSTNASGFVQRMISDTPLSVKKVTYWPYLEIFMYIVECYGRNPPNITRFLNKSLYLDTRQDEHRTASIIAPVLAGLIANKEVNDAELVVSTLLGNPNIQNEVSYYFEDSTTLSTNEPAYSHAYAAIRDATEG